MLNALLHPPHLARLTCCIVLAGAAAIPAQDPAQRLDLRLLYVGKPETPRAKAFTGFFRRHLRSVLTAPLDGSATGLAGQVDVVVLDWQQDGDIQEMFDEKRQPLGVREKWRKPTLLLGSAGLLLSSGWRLRGGFG